MSAGPVGSEYPGTPVAIMMAALFSVLLVKSLLPVFRRGRNGTKQSYGANVVVAIVAAYLLAMVLWAIWISIHR
jgi:hypothetical protein